VLRSIVSTQPPPPDRTPDRNPDGIGLGWEFCFHAFSPWYVFTYAYHSIVEINSSAVAERPRNASCYSVLC